MEIVYLYVEELDSKGKVTFATECMGVVRDGVLYTRQLSCSDLLKNYEFLQVKLDDCQECAVALVPDEIPGRHFMVSVPEVTKPRADPRLNILPEWYVDAGIREEIEQYIIERDRILEEIYG